MNGVRKLLVLLTLTTLVAAACASRDGDSPAADGERSDSDLEATGPGVTATEIRVGVVADVDNPVRPGLFQVAMDGVQAWAAKVNADGGLAGRKVVVDELDSRLNPQEYRNAVTTACEKDLVLLGSMAIFDNAVEGLEECGLPDIPANATSTEHREAPTSFSVNPQTAGSVGVGPWRWYLENIEDCCRSAVLIPNQPVARESTIAGVNAANEIGFEPVYDLEIGGEELNFTPIVLEFKSRGANYVRNGLDYVSTVRMRREAQVQGVNDGILVWDCGVLCYTPDLITEGGDAVEGQYVAVSHVPIEEADAVPAMQAYRKYVKETGGLQGTFGVQGFAAGLLLEEVVGKIVERDGPNAVTREAILKELKGIHEFDAQGLIGAIDIGAQTPTGCFALLQVRDGKFVRVHPEEPGSLDCAPENIRETHVVRPGGR